MKSEFDWSNRRLHYGCGALPTVPADGHETLQLGAEKGPGPGWDVGIETGSGSGDPGPGLVATGDIGIVQICIETSSYC